MDPTWAPKYLTYKSVRAYKRPLNIVVTGYKWQVYLVFISEETSFGTIKDDVREEIGVYKCLATTNPTPRRRRGSLTFWS